MNQFIIFKLVLRSWKRNKLFIIISLVSLIVGITCTNLLTAFVLYEYHIESHNPNKERILRLTQSLPFTQQEMQGTFVYHKAVPEIISSFPEIESYLRTKTNKDIKARVGEHEFSSLNMVAADSTFETFFPMKTISGVLLEALTKPEKIAVSEQTALQIFGTEACVGKILEIPGMGTYQITAVFRQPVQSMMQVDLLTSLPSGAGMDCMVLIKQDINRETFRKRLETTELPTLLGRGYYLTQTLQESYFDTTLMDSNACIEHRQIILLGVGLLTAILILTIACFNYVNLSFSRLLKQIRMLHIETMMGATHLQIRWQLFIDIFLMVFVAFLFSFLLMNDLLPVFNRIIAAHLTFAYLFSWQVFPVILLFIGVLSLLPASYMSRKIHTLSESRYRSFFTGRKKQHIVSVLVTLQFIISMGLMSSFLIIRSQMSLIEQEGCRFENIIELNGEEIWQPSLLSQIEEIKRIPGVKNIVPSTAGLYPMTMAIPRQEKSENDLLMLELYEENLEFLSIYQLEVLDSQQMNHLLSRSSFPTLVNESFIRLLVPAGENAIGQPVAKYTGSKQETGVIVGVLKDFKKYSLTGHIAPLRMLIHEIPQENFHSLIIQTDGIHQTEIIRRLQNEWKKRYPHYPFQYEEPYQVFMKSNEKVATFSRILLMYACISLFLTLFGLFGITRYAIQQRAREIAIRKIHGASFSQILWLLNRPFLYNITIAFVLIVPVSYYLTNLWLQHFAYQIQPSIVHFLLPLLLTIGVTLLTVCLNGIRTVRSNPAESIQPE